ncbi:hypothetical protein DIE07_09055 [Burkholderia sp. Bp9002]|nr:hypothetical protein DIE07_09055 [Burkholderia sp. Bp9002]
MTRVDLLCYLVTSQLAARVRTGEWLAPDHLVAAMHVWQACHRTEFDWLDRLRIGATSITLAQGIYDIAIELAGIADGERIWVDANAPELRALRMRCEALLQRLDGDAR